MLSTEAGPCRRGGVGGESMTLDVKPGGGGSDLERGLGRRRAVFVLLDPVSGACSVTGGLRKRSGAQGACSHRGRVVGQRARREPVSSGTVMMCSELRSASPEPGLRTAGLHHVVMGAESPTTSRPRFLDSPGLSYTGSAWPGWGRSPKPAQGARGPSFPTGAGPFSSSLWGGGRVL